MKYMYRYPFLNSQPLYIVYNSPRSSDDYQVFLGFNWAFSMQLATELNVSCLKGSKYKVHQGPRFQHRIDSCVFWWVNGVYKCR